MSRRRDRPVFDEYGTLGATIWGNRRRDVGVYDMVPMPPAGWFHPCAGCPADIEPDEPYYLSKDGEVAWCDACMEEAESEL